LDCPLDAGFVSFWGGELWGFGSDCVWR
jgi:hypothetical protein